MTQLFSRGLFIKYFKKGDEKQPPGGPNQVVGFDGHDNGPLDLDDLPMAQDGEYIHGEDDLNVGLEECDNDQFLPNYQQLPENAQQMVAKGTRPAHAIGTY